MNRYSRSMRIGVLSDTHDNLANMRAALELFARERVGLVVHCGDWKSPATLAACAGYAKQLSLQVRGALGNNDVDVNGMLEIGRNHTNITVTASVLTLKFGNKRLAAYHGHHKPTLRTLLADTGYDIILLGHTHKPVIQNEEDGLIVNPGSTAFAIPRSKTWCPSVAVVDTETMSAEIRFVQ